MNQQWTKIDPSDAGTQPPEGERVLLGAGGVMDFATMLVNAKGEPCWNNDNWHRDVLLSESAWTHWTRVLPPTAELTPDLAGEAKTCQHTDVTGGRRIPLAHGSAASLLCLGCGAYADMRTLKWNRGPIPKREELP